MNNNIAVDKTMSMTELGTSEMSLEMARDGWRWLEMGRGTAALRPVFKGKVIVGWLPLGHFSGSSGLKP